MRTHFGNLFDDIAAFACDVDGVTSSELAYLLQDVMLWLERRVEYLRFLKVIVGGPRSLFDRSRSRAVKSIGFDRRMCQIYHYYRQKALGCLHF